VSALGIHAGLALADVVAGLPVAAVVQWNREPPREMWSRVGAVLRGSASDDSFVLFSSRHWFFDVPFGRRVTSVQAGDGYGSAGSVYLSNLTQRGTPYRRIAWRLFRAKQPFYEVAAPLEHPTTVDGVEWHLICLEGPL
jgi:hypothetical protein